jgi:hypothetical protein
MASRGEGAKARRAGKAGDTRRKAEEEEGDEEGEEEGREAGAASGLIPVSSTHLMARPGAGADIGISPARVEARHPLLRWEFESKECSEC